MTPEDVYATLHRHTREVLHHLPPDRITPDSRLADLGADSLDRMDILVGTVEELGLSLDPTTMAAAPDLAHLARALHRQATARPTP
ncbi:phosphopantetheine-binding protein (plasmid) [Streptomyces sp. BI20]|uniref:phosphopantetheine-binding protein n=1 Tax=Streptomyces sp. BI20 TaxID=3403460 RepID=UPI003C72B981